MAFFGLLGRGRYERTGFVLYTTAVAAARDPYFYAELGVPDTLDGRFDLVGLHAALLIRRLRALPAPGAAISQAVFDAMFSDMDINIRELGAGDVTVARNVRAMWEAFHGRATAYEAGPGRSGPGGTRSCPGAQHLAWRDRTGRRRPGRSRPGNRSPLGCRAPSRVVRRQIRLPRTGAIMISLELSRPIPADRVGSAPLTVTVEATEAECAAIARRLLVPSVESLQCRWSLRAAPGGVVEAEGSLHARLHQECVVSLDPFPAEIVEEFAVRFVPEGQESEDADDPDEPDELPIEGNTLELGEATVEQLALALDPYPRKPGAELPDGMAGEVDTPFSALAKLRKPD